MLDQRPNPDELLQRVQSEAEKQTRGLLKIFLGAAAGVGKTYAMLETAHDRIAAGVDVVVGYAETHGRAETDSLLVGLEQLPPLLVEYRGTTLREFDLDAALSRSPELILVDELAHTNAAGLRHAKRWQDVEELLNAGIDVFTTVNIQHLESLNDLVAQITGIVVSETIPDRILDEADEVELIDLPADELLQRLREGRVYIPAQAERAIQSFFRKGNLMALRELALRRTADRVDAQMQLYRHEHAIPTTWPTQERLIVCVSPSPLAKRLVRATRRMAARLQAEWLAVYVETAAHTRLSEKDRQRVALTLRLAEKLGAKVTTLSGAKVSEEVLRYARQHNVSKIVVGKPEQSRWQRLLFSSVVDEIIHQSGEIDVYVIHGEHDDSAIPRGLSARISSPRMAYVMAMLVVLVCSLLVNLLYPLVDLANGVMIYLLGVTFVAYRYGRGPSILTSLLSVATLDFFFVPPFLTLTVSDAEFFITFAVMLVVALTISTLTTQVRAQVASAREREHRTSVLYEMTRDFASKRGLSTLLQVAVQHISNVFACQALILLPDAKTKLVTPVMGSAELHLDERDLAAAQWVFEHRQMAGMNTDTLPNTTLTFLPLLAASGAVGVLAVRPSNPQLLLDPDQMHLLETFANQTSVAIERAQLADETQEAQVQIETERLRNSLLSSVSHDLRTPLASITGAATSLLQEGEILTPADRQELTATIAEESERLNQLVANLLEMTKLESGAIAVKKEWQPLEEVIGAALTHLKTRLNGRPLIVELPPDLTLVPLDEVLIEQVLINLIENAIRYTPTGSAIEISAKNSEDAVIVSVADHGLGIPPDTAERIFDKFFRAPANNMLRGSGLGLTICRGIINAHGGHIWSENRSDGSGAIFSFTLPLDGETPALHVEE
ncbi:MAG: sensor histidine kinase KdpD [Caldilineaceae bacterium]